jgi:hypothetical protein
MDRAGGWVIEGSCRIMHDQPAVCDAIEETSMTERNGRGFRRCV